MRLVILFLVPLVACLAFSVEGTDRARAQESNAIPGGEISVSLSAANVTAITGDSFSFTSTVTNSGSEATPPLVANLNFVSLDGKTFVDPEDWSNQRTIHLDSIAANSSADQTWTVEPVLGGEVAVYVVILPAPYDLASSGPLASSLAIHLSVSERRALNPGGVLPVVLAVPAFLGLVSFGLRKARDRI